jgi:transcriptional regulator with XRE-family HTH domain
MVETLKEAIRGDGRSLSELGRLTGVDVGRLSRFMRGQRGITLTAAAELCKVLGLQLARPAAEDAPKKMK